MAAVADLRTIAAGLDHPEGVAVAPDGALYAGGEAGQLYRVPAGGGAPVTLAQQAGGFILGVALDGAGAVYACDCGTGAVLRLEPGGTIERYCEAASGTPLDTPNWAAFASDGALWLSDSGTEDPAVRDGRLVRIPPGGGDGEALDLPALHFPNGLCVAPDDTVYLLESFTPQLSRLGAFGLETVADLPGTTPDGVALQADGSFVVACYYPYRLLHVAPGGGVEVLLDDPVGAYLPMPTNVAHMGEGLGELAIALLGGTEIKALAAPGPGAPLHRP